MEWLWAAVWTDVIYCVSSLVSGVWHLWTAVSLLVLLTALLVYVVFSCIELCIQTRATGIRYLTTLPTPRTVAIIAAAPVICERGGIRPT